MLSAKIKMRFNLFLPAVEERSAPAQSIEAAGRSLVLEQPIFNIASRLPQAGLSQRSGQGADKKIGDKKMTDRKTPHKSECGRSGTKKIGDKKMTDRKSWPLGRDSFPSLLFSCPPFSCPLCRPNFSGRELPRGAGATRLCVSVCGIIAALHFSVSHGSMLQISGTPADLA